MATKPQRLKYVVHYKEAPDKVQWDETFYDKVEADKFALEIFLNGGMSLTITEYEDDPEQMIIGPIKENEDEEAS